MNNKWTSRVVICMEQPFLNLVVPSVFSLKDINGEASDQGPYS